MFAFRFALRNVLSRKSSVVIFLFITFSISLLSLSNAVFDGTDNGLERTFIDSFTGDAVIRPISNMNLSLFGDDTPILGKFSKIPALIPYKDVLDYVNAQHEVETSLSQVYGYAALRTNNGRIWADCFGIEADEYVPQMKGIHVMSGRPYAKGEKGIMLSRGVMEKLKDECELEDYPKVGDKIQIYTTNGATINIRLLTITGTYRYEVENSNMNNIALVDPDTLRELLDMGSITADEDIDPENMNLINGEWDSPEDIFSDAGDVVGVEAESQDFGEDKPLGEETAQKSTVWSYIIIKAGKKVNVKSFVRKLNKTFHENDWPVEAVKWRSAAGGNIAMVFFIKLVMNAGIILVLLTGFIVIANTLMISALSRMTETGTLRAIGARRSFILCQFFFETALLTFTAGIAGCLLGAVFQNAVNAAGIRLTNSLLIQLFGGEQLKAVMLPSNVTLCMTVASILTLIGWYFPVRIAMDANPVVAMRGQL